MKKTAERKAFERWYCTHAFDFVKNPIGSRECSLQWEAWQARAEMDDKRDLDTEARYRSSFDGKFEMEANG